MTNIQQQFERWKAQLLDLSRRNRMLHTRPGAAGTVALVQPGLDTLFDLLVRRRRKLPFAAALTLEERLAALSWNEPATGQTMRLDRLPAPSSRAEQLVTDLLPPDQERALYNLRLKSRSALGEQGVNVLFVALGFLEWFDSASPELVMRSPLLLLPVELQRAPLGLEYSLRLLDDELVLNPTLVHKLRRDYGLHLPTLPDDEEDLHPEQIFAAVNELVAQHDGWQVRPEATLGLFSFLKLLLYHDLEQAATLATTHPVLSLLAGASTAEFGIQNAELSNANAEDIQHSAFSIQPLDQRSPDECYQVLDADASQLEAVLAARAAQSFVLHGPPGTGKSQTITNIIAECLAEGKRILFVSEKMAALEVVYERLRACGLAEFCLELHSHKASKRVVLDALAATLATPQPPVRPAFPYGELSATRDQLNAYARALHTPLGALGWTTYQVHGRIALVADAPECPLPLEDLLAVSAGHLGAIDALLLRLDTRRDLLVSMPQNVWRGCSITVSSFEQRGRIRSHLRILLAALGEVVIAATQAAAVPGLPAPTKLGDARVLVALADLLGEPHVAPGVWLAGTLGAEHAARRVLLAEAQARSVAQAEAEARLFERYQPAVLELELDGLVARFGSYTGLWRLLRPSYHSDRNTLMATLKPGAHWSYETALADLQLANEVRAGRQWEQQNGAGLAAQLGPHYVGRTSDWAALKAAADWLARVLALPLPEVLPQPLALALSDATVRGPLPLTLEPLAAALARLDAELTFVAALTIE